MDIEAIKQLMHEFEDSKISKMRLEIENIKLELEKDNKELEAVPVVKEVTTKEVLETPTIEAVEVSSGIAITSPIVGVYYAASSPVAKPYVEVGSVVKKGQVVCIVEAMKVMNEIKAPIDGTIKEIKVKSEDMVEFNQTLMMIEG